MMEWINVNDMTPEQNDDVLVLRYIDGFYFADFGNWNGTEWAVEDYEAPLGDDVIVDDIMYWMPIPGAPEEG